MPRLLKTAMAMVAAIITIALIAGALIGPSLWDAAYAFMLALGVRDWLQWRDSDMTAREVADRFMAHLLIFAIGVAMPAFGVVESWIGS